MYKQYRNFKYQISKKLGNSYTLLQIIYKIKYLEMHILLLKKKSHTHISEIWFVNLSHYIARVAAVKSSLSLLEWKQFHSKRVKFYSCRVNFDSEKREILLCHSLRVNCHSLKSEIFTLLEWIFHSKDWSLESLLYEWFLLYLLKFSESKFTL